MSLSVGTGPLPRGVSGGRGGPRRRVIHRPPWSLVLSLGVAASIGVMVYLAVTSVPFLASTPTTDPVFGELNQCLLDTLGEPRVGFAVSPDGTWAVSYGDAALALCQGGPRDAGRASGTRYPLTGVSQAAFDFSGALWLSRERRVNGDDQGGLWRLAPGGAPARVGDFAAVALAGHADGVVALDPNGKLLSLSTAGGPLGVAQLPAPPSGAVQLSANVDGSRIAAVAGGGLFVYSARTLQPQRAEGPCQVQFLWWRDSPSRAVVACGPRSSWALELWLEGEQRDLAAPKERAPSALVPRRGLYVQGCDNLPCSAPPP